MQQQRGKFVLIVEGAVMQGFGGNALRIAGRPAIEDLKALAEAAAVVLAVGSCAVDGGWVKARPDQAGATGVMSVVDPSKVVNLPTCPVNPEWVVAMIVDYLLLGRTVPVDNVDARAAADIRPDDPRQLPETRPLRERRVRHRVRQPRGGRGLLPLPDGLQGSADAHPVPGHTLEHAHELVRGGGLAVHRVRQPRLGGRRRPVPGRRLPASTGVSPETVGVVLGGAALAGIVVHGIAQTATGRMGRGGPLEEADDEAANAPEPEPDVSGERSHRRRGTG